jgi:hypothetical protein
LGKNVVSRRFFQVAAVRPKRDEARSTNQKVAELIPQLDEISRMLRDQSLCQLTSRVEADAVVL